MGTALIETIKHHFSSLPDPRRETLNMRHNFYDILTIAICGVICGADDWTQIARFGEAKKVWLGTFLELPNGIPSHDTFNDVFAKMDPEVFQAGFIAWVASMVDLIPKDVVAIDGKTLRRSYDKASSKAAIHMVSAWCTSNQLILGQLKTEEKSNEITAIPRLLQLLSLKDSLVTIDAMGCQHKIAAQIVEQGADYLLGVKENQSTLYDTIHERFIEAEDKQFMEDFTDCAVDDKKDRHGRFDKQRCYVSQTLKGIEGITDKWLGLTILVVIESEATEQAQTTLERRFYISSRVESADYFLKSVRRHWEIENKLHWVLDVAYREDDSRHRLGYSAENFAVLRHISLNLIKKEKTDKAGVKTKRLKAGWDHEYLRTVLMGLAT
jgi:predicted transposase YbfD/YdcC